MSWSKGQIEHIKINAFKIVKVIFLFVKLTELYLMQHCNRHGNNVMVYTSNFVTDLVSSNS